MLKLYYSNFAGFLKAVCGCMVIMMQSLDAGPAPKKPPCNLERLVGLTRHRVELSLTGFVSVSMTPQVLAHLS